MLPMILPPVENVPLTRLEHLRPLMKNVNCKVIVLKKLEEKPTKDGHRITTLKVADESGSAILTLWDDMGAAADGGDILLVACGFVTMFQNEIRLGCRVGTVLRQGRFALQFSELPDHSSFCWMQDPDDPSQQIKQVPDGTKTKSRSKLAHERASKDPRRNRSRHQPDQSALH